MEDSKLINYLKILKESDLKRFRLFMDSPFFKKSKNSIALFKYIDSINYYIIKKTKTWEHPLTLFNMDLLDKIEESLKHELKNFVSNALSKKTIAQKLFSNKGKEKREKSLSVTATELVQLIKQFLIQLQVEKEMTPFQRNKKKPLYDNYLLLKILKRYDSDKLFVHTYDKIMSNRTNDKITIDYYYKDYLLKEIYYNFSHKEKYYEKNNREKKSNIKINDVLNSFEKYSCLNQLQQCCFALTKYSIVTKEKGAILIANLLNTIENKELKKAPLIKLYYLSLLLLTNRDSGKVSETFEELKNALLSDTSFIHKNELRNIYTIATNFYTKKIREGEINFYEELFDLYKLMRKEEFIYNGKYIIVSFMKNIVSAGLHSNRIEKIEEVEKIIKEDKTKIHPNHRDSVHAFNEAALLFYKKEFKNAYNKLKEVSEINMFYKFDIRGLQLKCCYELKDNEDDLAPDKNTEDILEDLLNSFSKLMYSKKEQISQEQQKPYLNFIKFTQRMYKLWGNPNKSLKHVLELEKSLKNTLHLNNRIWLMEKINELKR